MTGYIWATIGCAILGPLLLAWTLGWGPKWAYPAWVYRPKSGWVAQSLAFAASLTLFVGAGVMAERATQYVPPCAVEDGGPDLPCQWDGGVNENGLHATITYRKG